ncbi:glycosyltransferase family 69 protein [Schizophyllum commune]
MAIALRRRSLTRLALALFAIVLLRYLFSSSSSSTESALEIQEHNFIERATRGDKSLNVQKHRFLQARMGRDERPELFQDTIKDGMDDFWDRYQLPFIINKETSSISTQNLISAIDHLLSLNGWVAALCPTLTRPFGQNKHATTLYNDMISQDHLYYVAIVIHSADHFLVDQLAVVVQLAKRLGTTNLFVSMLDYGSTDSTETLVDLCEAVLTLLGIPFRIRRVPGMTEDPLAAYYPLEEAHMRNLALEPLHELHDRRGIAFKRVVWLKGFTCPNDILESIKISFVNEAAMVCGMDWAEHNGAFIFSDRWRTRDILGDQFRQSKSASSSAPPRDAVGAQRYTQHLPFQVFCCESGTHVVDPGQSYYKGIRYRAGLDFQNVSKSDPVVDRAPDAACLDSSQAHFCRDLWLEAAREGVEEVDNVHADGAPRKRKAKREDEHSWWKRQDVEQDEEGRPAAVDVARGNEDRLGADPGKLKFGDEPNRAPGQRAGVDADANVGSDYDASPDEGADGANEDLSALPALSIPNALFRPARILVNPRCPTTYAGVSHTQLALDLFGQVDDKAAGAGDERYILEDWEGAPESFVCHEQRQTGGRTATKTQRRLGFSLHDELERGRGQAAVGAA